MPVHTCRHHDGDLDDLLRRFLGGDAGARDKLPRVVRPHLLGLARRLGRDLPVDVQEELVEQAWINLLRQKPAAFNPGRGDAYTFLRLMLRNAAWQVRAAYRRPGQPSRRRLPQRSFNKAASASAQAVSFEDLTDAEIPHTSMASELESRHDAEAVLSMAPEPIATWLRRLYMEDSSLKEVAASAGISRFKVARQLTEFARERRAA